ncbi:hypothetical protein THRCLA_00348 [Thraustotheca clavata]|uniref:AD domain-containing protein n=1 Tax=Thraustotheca clavata TaxID=74557 RepID=A0A1W0ABF8_9STRA|nr:hypothetical protein THRCLA_00348 [Thraustotheca clavata]
MLNEELIGKAVKVHLQNKSFLHGALYSIDPENDNVILFILDKDTSKVLTRLIMGHTIVSITNDDEENMDIDAIKVWLQEHVEDQHEPLSLEATRTALQEYLSSHCIDSSIDSNDHIVLFGGAATIAPPYNANSISSQNDIVIQRLTTLLKSWRK